MVACSPHMRERFYPWSGQMLVVKVDSDSSNSATDVNVMVLKVDHINVLCHSRCGTLESPVAQLP